MIQIQNVSKVYTVQRKQIRAVDQISFDIDAGEIYGIIGHSGAGKSTLLRMINGLEQPTSGEVLIDGTAIHQLKASALRNERQKIGMIFQHFHLLWSRTVRENIAFPLEIAGWSKKKIEERVTEVLEWVGLTERAEAYPSQLSGGQKQRVGIARALANNPKLLLCDEATSALDPETTRSILGLLQEINRKTGITIVLITHQMSVITSICDKVAVLSDGKLIESGKVADILADPKQEVTRKFLLQQEEEKDSILLPYTDWDQLQQIVQENPVQIQQVLDPVTGDKKIKVVAPLAVLEKLGNQSEEVR
ncbi:methionine ABC transporter ATP-binding protein [Risungbinella massiliensis]|uniref:methionine ABC transporter ATP-binding protein n=1 Tax=Risungbinella massiliensis TaxID=1329796 RepID=UPI00069B20DE|nr:ATP-binding cassette domain-containing protein [Risungbinella massiliensis]